MSCATPARDLDRTIDAINALGFGLTFGLHTRLDETIDHVTARIRAGNIYVNRNIIGAVVGVQPFGGQGMSGTGPKAGGPLYVRRLVEAAACRRRCVPNCCPGRWARATSIARRRAARSCCCRRRARA